MYLYKTRHDLNSLKTQNNKLLLIEILKLSINKKISRDFFVSEIKVSKVCEDKNGENFYRQINEQTQTLC